MDEERPLSETRDPRAWRNQLEERERKELELAEWYAMNLAHGTPGHLDLMLLAKLARYIDFLLA